MEFDPLGASRFSPRGVAPRGGGQEAPPPELFTGQAPFPAPAPGYPARALAAAAAAVLLSAVLQRAWRLRERRRREVGRTIVRTLRGADGGSLRAALDGVSAVIDGERMQLSRPELRALAEIENALKLALIVDALSRCFEGRGPPLEGHMARFLAGGACLAPRSRFRRSAQLLRGARRTLGGSSAAHARAFAALRGLSGGRGALSPCLEAFQDAVAALCVRAERAEADALATAFSCGAHLGPATASADYARVADIAARLDGLEQACPHPAALSAAERDAAGAGTGTPAAAAVPAGADDDEAPRDGALGALLERARALDEDLRELLEVLRAWDQSTAAGPSSAAGRETLVHRLEAAHARGAVSRSPDAPLVRRAADLLDALDAKDDAAAASGGAAAAGAAPAAAPPALPLASGRRSSPRSPGSGGGECKALLPGGGEAGRGLLALRAAAEGGAAKERVAALRQERRRRRSKVLREARQQAISRELSLREASEARRRWETLEDLLLLPLQRHLSLLGAAMRRDGAETRLQSKRQAQRRRSRAALRCGAAAAAACLAAFLLSPRAELTYGDVERIAFGECADCEEGAAAWGAAYLWGGGGGAACARGAALSPYLGPAAACRAAVAAAVALRAAAALALQVLAARLAPWIAAAACAPLQLLLLAPLLRLAAGVLCFAMLPRAGRAAAAGAAAAAAAHWQGGEGAGAAAVLAVATAAAAALGYGGWA